MDERKNKSQLAEDLDHALFVCRLRDDLSALVDDATVPERLKKQIHGAYLKATVLLACAMVDSKELKRALGQ